MDPEVVNTISGTGWVFPVSTLVAAGGTIAAAIKMIYKNNKAEKDKFYEDMRKDRDEMLKKCQEREDKLYSYLNKKNETDLKVALALEGINNRLTNLECKKG